MRVLHVSPDYPYTTLYQSLQCALLHQDVDSFVYVPLAKKSELSSRDERVMYRGVFKENDRVLFHYKQRKVFKGLMREIQNANPQVLHAHFLFSAGYACYLANMKTGIPYIVAVRNTDVNVFLKRCFWLRSLGKKVLLNASRVIYLSESYREYVTSKFFSTKDNEQILCKSLVIPNGIDESWFARSSNAKMLKGSTIRLISAGAINQNKNHLTTLAACQELVNRGYNARLSIAGKIENEHLYHKLVESNLLTYLGILSIDELINEYMQEDIYVMPSFTETFGLSYVEAMTCGLPVIYTRGQGFDGQFSEGEVGYHVDPASTHDIADKIELIINDYDNISKNCIRKTAKFHWRTVAQEYYDVYRSIEREQGESK